VRQHGARAARFLLQSPGGALLVAAAFFIHGLHAVQNDRYLNDEGLLTWFFAAMTLDDPVAVLFFQKSRPVLSALYAPVTVLGLQPFLIAHVIVATLAIPLTASLARGAGQRWPNLAAILLALSPLMLGAAPAGVSNADVVTGALLSLWLLERARRPLWAGAVLGALLLVRAEIGVLVVVLGAGALRSPAARRLLAGVAVVPLAYALAGIAYHQAPLWVLHFPPSLPSVNPGVPTAVTAQYGGTIDGLVSSLVLVTPAVALAALVPRDRLSSVERTAGAFVLLFVLLVRGLPLFGLFNFDDAPRYLVPTVPFVALLVGRLAGRWHDLPDRGALAPVWLGALLVAGHFTEAATGSALLLWCVVGWAAVLVIARAGRAHLATGALVVGCVAGAFLLAPKTRLLRSADAVDLGHVAHVLVDHRAETSDVVVTNVPVLATWLERRETIDYHVRYLVQADQLHEIRSLTNGEVGQTERILDLLDDHFYGRPLLPDDLDAEALPDRTAFVLREDERLEAVLPPEAWEPRLRDLDVGRSHRVAVLREEGAP